MADKLLFILLEGNDDERFFEKIVKPLLQERYYAIRFWKYASQRDERIVELVRSIRAMKGDCIYVRDFDNAVCITAKKEQVRRELNQVITDREIIIVVEEIESWYLAGLDDKVLKRLGIRRKIGNTDDIAKEEFDRLIPKNKPRVEFMQEILANYGNALYVSDAGAGTIYKISPIVIPEPSTFILFGIAVLACLGYSRRCRKSST